MEAVCSGVTPSPFQIDGSVRGNEVRNSRGTVRVGYRAPQCQRLFFRLWSLSIGKFEADAMFQEILFLLKHINE
jgi:hypothetical protein